jgi:DNA invertase Pin-like site-specific DNA recombinase
MSKILAMALCRVSTPEQRQNNSLNRQEQNVLKAAEDLGAEIPEDAWWSGNVSSKAGTNLKRKDLKEMLAYCKQHRNVKYFDNQDNLRHIMSLETELEKLNATRHSLTIELVSNPRRKADLESSHP